MDLDNLLEAIIPSIIIQILNGKKEIELGSLETRRDFTYVDDTVNGFYKLLSHKKIMEKFFIFQIIMIFQLKI